MIFITLTEKLKKLPALPGVYLMKNKSGTIIYVGKAKVLKNRVRQYFHSDKAHSPKVKAMVSNIDDFEIIITANEREAFVLECNLIKEHRPRYNILLKDDKTYPYIKITNDRFPKIVFTRQAEKGKGEYFGPYTSSAVCREMIETANKIFRLPTCNRRFPEDFGKKRPCLYYSMSRCMGVCTGKISREEYSSLIKDAADFLSGKRTNLISRMESEMLDAAQNLQFERAASLRDKINSIKYIEEKHNLTILKGAEADIFSFAAKDNDLAFEVIFIRDGKMTGHDSFSIDGGFGVEDSIIMSDFVSQYYEKENTYVPRLVVLDTDVENLDMIESFLTEKKGTGVEIRRAVRGKYRDLCNMARKNAEKTLEEALCQKEKFLLKKSAAEELGKILGLETAPLRIEAYDISHTAGDLTVGAMVVYKNGKYSKEDNRYFKIKTVSGNDDYSSLREVLTRRFSHCLSEYEKLSREEIDEDKAKFSLLPDLILMDGGHGQLSVAEDVLKSFGLPIPVFGMVKDDKHRTRGLVSSKGEIAVNPLSPAFRLLTNIQDEVHRLAIGYHKKLREKKLKKSPLLDLDGVGEATYQKLMKHFKTVSAIKNATEEELSKAVGKRAAKSVFEFYRK